jgi:tocopherol cyclase
MDLIRRFQPWLFQGRVKTAPYFEGWYFKLCQADGHSCAFIPGISLAAEDRHAFIQFIDGSRGESTYLRYPLEAFRSSDKPFAIQVAGSSFSLSEIDIHIDETELGAEGRVEFGPGSPYPSGFLRAGIMGPFGLPGFLECYHGIVSADHSLRGGLSTSLRGQGVDWDFADGRGYSEKDWGTSFPRDYVWMQANSFASPGMSVFASLAAIPFRGLDFPGLICFALLPDRRFLTFATWNGAKVERLEATRTSCRVALRRASWRLELQVSHFAAAALAAPRAGSMDRLVKEGIDGRMSFSLRQGSALIAEGDSAGAGLEQGGDPERLARWFIGGGKAPEADR